MDLIELTPTEFSKVFPTPLTPYGSVDFNMLNASKADSVVFLAMADTKRVFRLGMILGRRGKDLYCPLSAPFGELSFNKSQKIETVCEFFKLLKEKYPNTNISLTLAPPFYNPDMHTKTLGVLMAQHGSTASFDYNYHYPLKDFAEFEKDLDGNARNHLNRALRENFTFSKTSLAEAYDVIAENRREHGYPLRMTLQQLEDTSSIIEIDSFVLSLNRAPAAAAIVYRLSQPIAQVIYWGHLNAFSSLRPMNLLAREVFKYYHGNGFEIVDLGPSSSEGQIDLGLATFKESLGARLTFKPTVRL